MIAAWIYKAYFGVHIHHREHTAALPRVVGESPMKSPAQMVAYVPCRIGVDLAAIRRVAKVFLDIFFWRIAKLFSLLRREAVTARKVEKRSQ